MKKVLAVLIIIAGILIGLYLGLYVMLYGGIVQIINAINPLNGKEIAFGILKILFCEIGAIPAFLGVLIGTYIWL